jgi:hypothetical protein
MAWHIQCNFPLIQSYAEAVKVWQNAVIWPKSPTGPRALADKRKKHMTIERTDAEDIILRLYGHPVMTWHKDGAFTVCEYPSRSTTAFVNRCIPPGVYASSSRYFFTLTVDGRCYKVVDEITFRQRDGAWKADKTTPWSVSVVNRTRAKLALHEVGYNEFRLWLKTYVQMAAKPDAPHNWSGEANNSNVITMLRNREWRKLAMYCPDAWDNPDQMLSEIRQIIYHAYKCIDLESVPFLG